MSIHPGVLICLIGACVGILAGPAAAQNAVTIDIGDAAGNPGDSAEIQVNLDRGTAAPAALILFFSYDSTKLEPIDNYYQFVDEDLQGNTVTRRGAVRPGPVLDQADKLIMTEVTPGEIAIAIFGLNETTINSGGLLTLAFRILQAAQISEQLIVAGDPDSSASPAHADTMPPIGVQFQNGFVTVGCNAPAAPLNLAATSNRSDGVLVSWSPIGVAGAQYRVYRSDTSDSAAALGLGDTWVTTTNFLDVTAGLPEVTPPAGCGGDPIVQPVTYYYWVKARTAEGCESDLAGPVQGTRTAGKAASAAAVLPLGSLATVLGAAAVLWLMSLRFNAAARRN